MVRLSSTHVKVSCVLLLTVYALYIGSLILRSKKEQSRGNTTTAAAAAAESASASYTASTLPLIAILLQQSPVDRKQQLARLRAIDEGWATQACSDEHVYAAVPSEQAADVQMRNVRVLPLLGEQQETAALKNAVASFKRLLLPGDAAATHSSKPYDWVVIANDHTFMLAPNLRRFLHGLDSDDMIYTGNMLQRGLYGGQPLIFASGGAGAVFSLPALKALLLAWAVLGTREVDEAGGTDVVNRQQADNISSRDTATREQLQSTLRAARAFAAAPQGHGAMLGIRLSRRASAVLFYKGSNMQFGVKSNPESTLRAFTLNQLHSGCAADGDFARINPGIVMASCLRLLGVASPSTLESGAERFNVYGLLRSLLGDVDGWYRDAKAGLAPGTHDEADAASTPGPPLVLARELVSFHYVSQEESALLHEALLQGGANAVDVARRWPRHRAVGVGAYARGVRSEEEARLIEHFLLHNVSVATCS